MVLKTRAEAKKNYGDSVAYIPARYKSGVSRADWQGPAGSDAAETNFSTAIAKAVADKSRQAGVKKVANTEWQKSASEKGGAVIGERIRAAIPKWDGNWGPMYDAVAAHVPTLPPKTLNWEENIDNRLKGTVRKWKEVAGKL